MEKRNQQSYISYFQTGPSVFAGLSSYAGTLDKDSVQQILSVLCFISWEQTFLHLPLRKKKKPQTKNTSSIYFTKPAILFFFPVQCQDVSKLTTLRQTRPVLCSHSHTGKACEVTFLVVFPCVRAILSLNMTAASFQCNVKLCRSAEWGHVNNLL